MDALADDLLAALAFLASSPALRRWVLLCDGALSALFWAADEIRADLPWEDELSFPKDT
jgi:hypothetical protein